MRRYAWRELSSLSCVVLASMIVGLVGLVGCIYDSDDRCSPGERVNREGYCVCMPNHVPKLREAMPLVTETEGPLAREGCIPCGAHQVVKGDKCACDVGFTANSKGVCLKGTVPDVNFGDKCTAVSDCTGPGATCIDDDELDGKTRAPYCSTRDCKDVSACPATDGYGCFEGPDDKFCRKAPSGEGDDCDMGQGDATNPSCTGEASACAFNRCTAPIVCRGDDDCTPGLICCDLSSIPAAMGAKICTTSAACPVD